MRLRPMRMRWQSLCVVGCSSKLRKGSGSISSVHTSAIQRVTSCTKFHWKLSLPWRSFVLTSEKSEITQRYSRRAICLKVSVNRDRFSEESPRFLLSTHRSVCAIVYIQMARHSHVLMGWTTHWQCVTAEWHAASEARTVNHSVSHSVNGLRFISRRVCKYDVK